MIGIGVAFIIGVSRIIVGVHYPIDILGGWGIAIVLYLIADFLLKKIENYLKKRNQKTT